MVPPSLVFDFGLNSRDLFSQFWKLEVQEQQVDRFGFSNLSLWKGNAGVSGSRLSLLIRISVRLD